MSGRYAVYYGLATALFGWLDKATGLNIGNYPSNNSPGFKTLFSTAVHAAMATWALDNFGLPLGVGSGSTRYIVLPLAAGAFNAVLGDQLQGWLSGVDGSNANLTAFLGEAISAGAGVWIFSRAI